MKTLYKLLISVIILNSCTQKKPINLVNTFLNELKIDKTECWNEFILEKKISNTESLIFIPKIKENKGGFSLDIFLLIVNNNVGKIVSKFIKKDCWYSDAVKLEDIKLIYKPYTISEKLKTIGIVINYKGSSKVYPYFSKQLTLFVREGDSIKRILEDYSMYTLNGENNGNNFGYNIINNKLIEPKIDFTLKFYDLIVTDSIVETEFINGTKKIIKKMKKTEILKYQNGKYKTVL